MRQTRRPGASGPRTEVRFFSTSLVSSCGVLRTGRVFIIVAFSADVITMLDKMIKAVDGELSEQGLLSIGDAVLPHIRHWNRLVTLLRNQAVGVITILPALLGISVLAILAVAVVTPIYLSSKLYEYVT